MSLQQRERELYSDVFASVTAYGNHSPGVKFLPVFREWAMSGASVLDAGCGTGQAAIALGAAGFKVTLCDLSDNRSAEARRLPFAEGCLWHSLQAFGPFDYVYCTDVLEHLPPQFTMLAVREMLAVARRGLFLSVSLVPDNFGVWVGTPLHHTVESYRWWLDNLKELAIVDDARDLIVAATFCLRPRRA